MRLTETHRAAFVRAVMDDVPTPNTREQVQKLVNEDMRQVLPAQIVSLMNNATYKGYLSWVSMSLSRTVEIDGKSRNIVGLGSVSVIAGYQPGATVDKKIHDLVLAGYKALCEREEMQATLRRAIKGCSTLKQAQDMFPELAKYLPSGDDQKTLNLPAASNVVADLTKLGWPRGKVPQ